MSGRVRLLFFWTGRREVGNARINWTSAADGACGLTLLIGTDPDRAPGHLNRWGYVAESTAGGTTTVLGVMTQSDEQTVEHARESLAATSSAARAYKAIRATVADGYSNSEVVRLFESADLTYRDLETLLARLPPPAAPRRLPMPPNADHGFLSSMAAVLHESVVAHVQTRRVATPVRRQYLHGGQPFDLTLRRARAVDALTLGQTTYRDVIDGEFDVRNGTTHETTEFEITYGTRDGLAEVPLQVQYHPRWWLALELTLKEKR
ncbi:MAG TPA: hypothetical protein VLT86_07275 [Vicinamibacterales bacterium]|nr:hypothetical protein [Vicinamibacterales bacterium]